MWWTVAVVERENKKKLHIAFINIVKSLCYAAILNSLVSLTLFCIVDLCVCVFFSTFVILLRRQRCHFFFVSHSNVFFSLFFVYFNLFLFTFRFILCFVINTREPYDECFRCTETETER